MGHSLGPGIHVRASLRELAEAAGRAIHAELSTAVEARGSCSMALAGGETPRGTYKVLGDMLGGSGAGSSIDIFWSDERMVPAGRPGSNYRMASETLLSRARIPPGRVHPVSTEAGGADEAAELYERVIRGYFGCPANALTIPRFDIVLLGVGADGHTASLFGPDQGPPGRLVIASTAPEGAAVRERVTFTYRLILAARSVHLIVSGAPKAAALAEALSAGPGQPPRTPAGMIISSRPVALWIDGELASGIEGISAG